MSRRIVLWGKLHRWSSLACTVFLLLLCVTGLPLVLRADMDRWLSGNGAGPAPAVGLEQLERMVLAAERLHPGARVISASIDEDTARVSLGLLPKGAGEPAEALQLRFHAASGELLTGQEQAWQGFEPFMDLLFSLHTDMFAGLAGALFLGAMALLFLVAIVSGVVLYGPFTQKLAFGTIRRERSARIRWLDMHNLLGIVTLCWAFMVGLTGAINELSLPLYQRWLVADVQPVLAAWQGRPLPALGQAVSVPDAVRAARPLMAGQTLARVMPPGDVSPWHFALMVHGDTPQAAWRYDMILVDAQSGTWAERVPMPWYMVALVLSRPFHFGNFGGLPLKLLWCVLDVMTIVVLGSGLYLWWPRRKASAKAKI
jgi:uncharacterized iron-regulated membrane protein